MDNQEIDIDIVNDPLNLVISDDDDLDMDIHSSDVIYENNYNSLENKPQVNGVTLQGDLSLQDIGIENDKNYVHTQNVASSTWVIEHNLNKYPAVSIMNSAGDEVVGEVFYDNTNQVTIKFMGAFKGKATLN